MKGERIIFDSHERRTALPPLAIVDVPANRLGLSIALDWVAGALQKFRGTHGVLSTEINEGRNCVRVLLENAPRINPIDLHEEVLDIIENLRVQGMRCKILLFTTPQDLNSAEKRQLGYKGIHV